MSRAVPTTLEENPASFWLCVSAQLVSKLPRRVTYRSQLKECPALLGLCRPQICAKAGKVYATTSDVRDAGDGSHLTITARI